MVSQTRPRRRADAERSIARIVAAARTCLSEHPDATIEAIAAEAGVGRMTLYGHFKTRADLVEAALSAALEAGEATLATVDLSGDPGAALDRLLASSWSLVAESAALLEAAQGVLPSGRLRELHAEPAKRVEDLLRRGQRDGVFRSDLPLPWLVSVVQYVLHGAAEQLRAGNLTEENVAEVAVATVRSVLDQPPAES
ncbi:TetR/AcrR family transcriptional regulator [Glycomyces terrestris]|uniref:TetR/AcrR family transcriptional regulator n=1 Tax=Glycomyces terrestris TaxID=2493553 RepID=A0A426V393_9ACTN|nr:TetR family transcriptional regulator [Glycomyces terrestris]RRS01337.1 TetR/AcrR family transcriptional regulator [Glycomyces terrestris]